MSLDEIKQKVCLHPLFQNDSVKKKVNSTDNLKDLEKLVVNLMNSKQADSFCMGLYHKYYYLITKMDPKNIKTIENIDKVSRTIIRSFCLLNRNFQNKMKSRFD